MNSTLVFIEGIRRVKHSRLKFINYFPLTTSSCFSFFSERFKQLQREREEEFREGLYEPKDYNSSDDDSPWQELSFSGSQTVKDDESTGDESE